MYRKTASDVLAEYIDEFEGRPRSRHYTKRVSDLLSPQPKFKYLDSVERQLDSEMNDKNEGLLSWINDSYQDSLRSTCRPAYLQQDADSTSQSRRDDHARSRKVVINKSNYASIREPTHEQILDDEISTLPSPSVSDVGIDSDHDTMETDVLLSSYQMKAGGQGNSSWVKNTMTNSAYPQWVDDVNQSVDAADPRRLSSVSVLLKSQNSNPVHSHSRSLNATGLTMDDAASVDTEVVLESSVYGNRPINMGGELHAPRFKDPRVESILNESRRKVKKHRENVLGRSVHGVSTASIVKAVQSPESRDVAYTNRILNKHRSFEGNSSGNSYSKGSRRQILQESNRERTTSSKAISTPAYSKEGRNSTTLYASSSPTVDRKNGSRDADSSRNAAITSRPGLNVSSPSIERPVAHDIDMARRPLVNDIPTRSHMKNLSLNISQKDIDVMESNSRGTSGYHSDYVSPIHVQKTLGRPSSSHRASSPKRVSPSERIRSPNRDQGTMRRKDSSLSQESASTDVLIRQPPIGTKLHQRSKTWASSSFKSGLPHAMSTPKPQLYANHPKAFNRHDDKVRYERSSQQPQYESARPRSAASQTVSGSASLGLPPSSSPHSTAVARMADGHSGPYLSSSPVAREAASKSRYSDSAVLTKPAGLGSSYTSWRSSALGSDRSGRFVVREEEVNGSTEVGDDVAEIVTGRYTAKDPHLSANDEEVNGEDLHNRTWPSLEKFKSRSKLSYSPRKDEISLSPKSSWTEQKRSIPLRPTITAETRNVSSAGSHPHSVINGHSYVNRPISHSSYSSTTTKHDQLSPNRNYSQSRTTGPSSRSSNIAGPSSRQFTPSKDAGQSYRSPSYAQRSSHAKERSPYTGNASHMNRNNTNQDNIDTDDDNATIDTDLLLIQPPMPVVDASPSLSTVSDDDSTVKDSDSGETSQSFAELPVRPSSKVSFAPDVSFNGRRGISPLSTFASTNPRTADLDAIRGSFYNVVEEGNRTQTFNSTLASEPKAMRSELIDSFIEDCMRSTNGASSDKFESKGNRKHFDGDQYRAEPPRTVETLKHMVLNLNGVASSYRGDTEEKAAFLESPEDYIESDNNSDDASSLVGEQSLARAYHHLERLKSLISGKVD